MLDLEPTTTRPAEPAPLRTRSHVAAPTTASRPDHQIVAVEPADAGTALRVVAAAATALTIALVAIGAATHISSVQAFGASAFFLVTLGSAGASLVRHISLASYALFSIAGSMVTTILTGFVLGETHWWYPTAAFVVLAAISMGLHGYALVSRRWKVEAGRHASSRISVGDALARVRGAAVPVLVSGAGLAALIWACETHAGSYASYGGALARVGPVWYAGLALLVIAVPLSVRTIAARRVTGLTVTTLATALALTPALLYKYPTVTSAARHVGVAEVMRHIGGVDHSGGIYHAWPGLFAGSGMMWDVGDVTNPLSWARWFPVLIGPASAIGVYLLARRVAVTRTGAVPDHRLWLGAAVFAVTNILGNAYFSPQSTCFVLAVAVLVLAIPTERSLTGRGKLLRITGLTVASFAVTITHQLTPYLVVLALFVLVVFKLVRPWYIVLLTGVPAIAWALINIKVLGQFINLGSIGNAAANAAPPNHGGDLGYRTLTKVAIYSPLLLFICVGAAALIAAIRLRNRLGWAVLACAVSPALLFFGNAYGNEAIFRVSLFSLPWLCLLLVLKPMRVRASGTAITAFLLAAAAVFSIGTYGLDWYRVIRPTTVTAIEKYEQTAPAGSIVLIPGSANAIPGRLTDRSPDVQYVPRDMLKILPVSRGYNPVADVRKMSEKLAGAAQQVGGVPAVYALLNTATGAYDDLYGIQRYSDFVRMRSAFASSGYWVPVYRSGSATLYRLNVQALKTAVGSKSR